LPAGSERTHNGAMDRRASRGARSGHTIPAAMPDTEGLASAESLSPEEVRRRLGVDFEAENHRETLAYWREASAADHGRVLAELMRYGEQVVKTTGIEKPAAPAVSELIRSRRGRIAS
jgi:hypothetical protein